MNSYYTRYGIAYTYTTNETIRTFTLQELLKIWLACRWASPEKYFHVRTSHPHVMSKSDIYGVPGVW
jgi:hypothetical protein